VGDIYRDARREILIAYSFSPSKERTARFFNFSQGKVELECKDEGCAEKFTSGLEKMKLEKLKVSLTKYTKPEGGFRKRVSGGPQCTSPMDVGYEVSLPGGRREYKKIIWMSPDRHELSDYPLCMERIDESLTTVPPGTDVFNSIGPILRQIAASGEHVKHLHAESLEFDFYRIDAETLLGIGKFKPFAVIFKDGLTSPFFEDQTSLVKLDGDLVDSIYRRCSTDTSAAVLESTDACFVEALKDGVPDNSKEAVVKENKGLFSVKNETTQSGNRYSGRWGAVLPLPKGADSRFIGGVYLNSKQELIISYLYDVGNNKFWRFFNFSQGKLEYECRPDHDQCVGDKLKEKLELHEILPMMMFVKNQLGEGFSIEEKMHGIYALRDGGYEVTSPQGDVRYEKIIWVSPEKHEFTLFVYDIDIENHIRAESLSMSYYQLDEKTILGLASGKPIVILFRNDMTSPYFESNKSLVQIDGKRADSVYGECTASSDPEESLDVSDECFVEFLKGEYPWLN
jgi:hypothetical protein